MQMFFQNMGFRADMTSLLNSSPRSVFLGGQLCPKPMSSCLISDFPKTMDLGRATFPRQDSMFNCLAKIFSWSSRLLRDVLAKFWRDQGVFGCMQLFANKAPCLSPHVVLIWLSSQRPEPFWRKTEFGPQCSHLPAEETRFLAPCALLPKSLHKWFAGNIFM